MIAVAHTCVMASADLLLHPVRIRIVQALLDGSELPTGELTARLGDIPVATLYRHVAKLSAGGVLTVTGETRVRGAVERRYALDFPNAVVTPETLRTMSTGQHQQAFTVFVATLLADFDRYLDRPEVDLVRDGVSYSQVALWLSDDELDELRRELAESLTARMANKRSSRRPRRMLTTILMPDR